MFVVRGIHITLPTLLTLSRIALIPFIVILISFFWWRAALFLFVIASVTDVLDGLLARWRNESTEFGAYLDPIADKLLIMSCLAALAYVNPIQLAVPWWLVVMVVCKEMILVVGIGMLRLMHGGIDIKPTVWGKCAMVLQALFVGWLCACYHFHWAPSKTFWSLIIGIICSVAGSFIHYGVLGLQQLMAQKTFVFKK